jgi:hypothetical protein
MTKPTSGFRRGILYKSLLFLFEGFNRIALMLVFQRRACRRFLFLSRHVPRCSVGGRRDLLPYRSFGAEILKAGQYDDCGN